MTWGGEGQGLTDLAVSSGDGVSSVRALWEPLTLDLAEQGSAHLVWLVTEGFCWGLGVSHEPPE